MLTPEKSRAARAQLDLSQRRVAVLADVPRSYLNQFECGRWIPTDAFLSKLTHFYAQHGIRDVEEPQPSAARQRPEPRKASPEAAKDPRRSDSKILAQEAPTSEPNSRSKWRTAGRAAVVIGLIGGVLAATGSLPAALIAIKRFTSAR